MASVATRPITIPFKSPKKDTKVWLLSDINDWQPQEMRDIDEGYEHTLEVPKDRQNVLYKFRIGDWDYANDPEAPSVPDGFGGVNNLFAVPAMPEPAVAIVPLLEESKPVAALNPESESAKVENGSRQVDLEDEAYHSSDSATPKASRAASISSHQGMDSVSSVSSVLPLTDETATKVDRAAGKVAQRAEKTIVAPAKEAAAEVLPSERTQATTSTPKAQALARKKKQDLPIYLSLAAITVAVVAYFLRLVQSFIPIGDERRIRGTITNAVKNVMVMLVAITVAVERAIEERRR